MKKYFLLLAVPFTLLSCLKDYDNPAEGTLNEMAELYVIRNAYQGGSITLGPDNLAGASRTAGVVISSKTDANIQPGTFVIQKTSATPNTIGDLTAGLVVDMGTADVPYVTGDSLHINVAGATLRRTGGRLVLSGITADRITKVADNRTALVRPVTISMLNFGFSNYESTLVAVHADATEYAPGATLSGEKRLSDNTGTLFLDTRAEAGFASTALPVNAQFTGIALYKNTGGDDTTGAKKVLMLRNAADIKFSSGAIYAGFPESFEAPEASAKASYNITATQNNIDLSTGNWKLQQAILGNTFLSDKINLPGTQCIRMQQNLTTSALLQMNFDVTQGASKVTVFYGRYGTDAFSTFRLEYSTNGGTTWVNVAPNITQMPDRGSTQATFLLNLSGNVRFRINKLGLGPSSATIQNGRLNLEDIAIYKKL